MRAQHGERWELTTGNSGSFLLAMLDARESNTEDIRITNRAGPWRPWLGVRGSHRPMGYRKSEPRAGFLTWCWVFQMRWSHEQSTFVLWEAEKHEPWSSLCKGQQLDSAHGHGHGGHDGTMLLSKPRRDKDVTTCLQWMEGQMVGVQLVT